MISGVLNFSRQYYYKLKKEKGEEIRQEKIVLEKVKRERKTLPRIGTRKLYFIMKEELKEDGIKCGRDKLFKYMREYNMGIKPVKRYVQTTNSKHWLKKYPNITKDIEITGPEQLWVSDITYIKTKEGNCYANVITDSYSRKIVGYSICDNMETKSMIKAYRMALKNKTRNKIATIHHSDRGVQYCSSEYVELSNSNNCKISMTENGNPYENALAERMNKTLKEEFGLGGMINSKETAYKLMEEAVYLYNNKRPHLALKYFTPEKVHREKSSFPHFNTHEKFTKEGKFKGVEIWKTGKSFSVDQK